MTLSLLLIKESCGFSADNNHNPRVQLVFHRVHSHEYTVPNYLVENRQILRNNGFSTIIQSKLSIPLRVSPGLTTVSQSIRPESPTQLTLADLAFVRSSLKALYKFLKSPSLSILSTISFEYFSLFLVFHLSRSRIFSALRWP